MSSSSLESPVPSLDLLTRMCDAVRELVVVTDADLTTGPSIVYANRAFWRTTGYEPEELLGKSPRVLQGPLTDRDMLRELKARLRAGESFEASTVNYRKNGSPYHIRWYIEPVRGADGEVEYFVGVQRDVTREVEREAQLARLEAAVEESGTGLLVMDDHDVIVTANPAAARVLGIDRHDLLGTPLARTPAGQALAEQSEPVSVPVVVEHEVRGTKRFLSVERHPSTRGDGGFVSVVDVSQRRRLEALAQTVNLLNHTGYLFAGLRHELGNPLNSIKTAVTVLHRNEGRFPAAKRSDYLERILQEIGRIEFLLKSLRNYNQHESQTVVDFELMPHLEGFLRVARAGAKGRQAVVLEGPRESIVVRGDPRGLYQALLNLVTNALDAIADVERGHVKVRVEQASGTAVVEIIDNGPGIPAERLENIGRPFVTTKPEGTGLGLPITYRVLSGMGASLEMDSEVGVGTTARITMPAVPA